MEARIDFGPFYLRALGADEPKLLQPSNIEGKTFLQPGRKVPRKTADKPRMNTNSHESAPDSRLDRTKEETIERGMGACVFARSRITQTCTDHGCTRLG